MQNALLQFNDNIERVKSLGGLHESLTALTVPVLDTSDILRSELVLAVSALDSYIHQIVEKGMVEVYENKRPKTKSFLKFHLSVECVIDALPNLIFSTPTSSTTSQTAWFSNEVHSSLSYKAFQHPDNIAEALRLICEKKVWDEVASCMGKEAKDLRNQLMVIVDRRNKIAHEADLNPAFPKSRWMITAQMVNEAVQFLEEIVYCIQYIVTN